MPKSSRRPPDGKTSSPFCSWLVVTPLDFWVCMEGGTRGREFLSPLSPPPSPLPSICMSTSLPPRPPLLFLSLTTEHCSCRAAASTSTQSEWIPVGSEVVCGLLWTRERERRGVRLWLVVVLIWGFLWPLCQGMCVSTPTICARHKHKRQRHADTHWPRLLPCV